MPDAPSAVTNARFGKPAFVAVYLAVCLVLFVTAVVAAWSGAFSPYVPVGKSEILKLYFYIAGAGGLGASVYCIRGLYKHCSLGDYEARYAYWYLFRPWIGAVLGVVSYLLIAAGFLALGCSGGNKPDPLRARMLYVAVGFMAGFSANEFVVKLNAVAKTLFGVDNPVAANVPAQGDQEAGNEPG